MIALVAIESINAARFEDFIAIWSFILERSRRSSIFHDQGNHNFKKDIFQDDPQPVQQHLRVARRGFRPNHPHWRGGRLRATFRRIHGISPLAENQGLIFEISTPFHVYKLQE